jgi:hypothetical protein
LAIITAEAKDEQNLILSKRALNLLDHGLEVLGGDVDLEAASFDKIFAACSGLEHMNGPSSASKKISPKDSNTTSIVTPSFKSNIGNKDVKGSAASETKKTSNKQAERKMSEQPTPPSTKVLQIFLDLLSPIVGRTVEVASCGRLMSGISSKMSMILRECFLRTQEQHDAKESSTRELFVARLEEFVMHAVCSDHCPPILMSCIKQSIEAGLMSVNAHITHDTESSSGTTVAPVNTIKDASQTPSSSLTVMLRVIERVTTNGATTFVENFASAILQVAEYISINSESQRYAIPTSPVDISNGKFVGGEAYATPTIGILEHHLDSGNGSTGGRKGGSGATNNRNAKSSSASLDSASTHTLILCVRLLGNSSVPYTFSCHRRQLFALLHFLLDSSDNIKLLITVVALLGKWMLYSSDEGCSEELVGRPLTAMEHYSFLLKISVLDGRFSTEMEGQPLHDLLSSLFLRLRQQHHQKERSRRNKIDPTKATLPGLASDDDADHHLHNKDAGNLFSSEEFILAKASSAGLMSSNAAIRMASGPAAVVDEAHILNQQSCLDIFNELLMLDWEGSGGRYWIAALAEHLLLCASQPDHVGIAPFKPHAKDLESRINTLHGQVQDLPCIPALPPYTTAASSNTASVLNANNGNSLQRVHQVFLTCVDQEMSPDDGHKRCLRALANHAHVDLAFSCSLFTCLFESVWKHATGHAVRDALTSSLEVLLTRPYHNQFLQIGRLSCKEGGSHGLPCAPPKTTNAVKALLSAVTTLKPIPFLDIDVLLSLARNYCAWTEVITILETYYSGLDGIGSQVERLGAVSAALSTCFVAIGDTDMSLCIALRTSHSSVAKRAITLDMYGRVDAALSLYQSEMWNDDPSADFEMSLAEMGTWEQRWLEMNKQSCQWEVLSNYCKTVESPLLQVECAWKSRDWASLRQSCTSPKIVALMEEGNPSQYMNEIFLTIADWKSETVENIHAQTSQLCLYQWQLLPKVGTGGNEHLHLFQMMHRLVETRESGQIITEAKTHAKNRTLPILKNLLTAWRERIPNEYDAMSVWDDLFTWRSHVFGAMSERFQWSDPSQLAGLHDRPWTAIQMARVARKQGMKDSSSLFLSKLTDCAMDVSDAFSKLREQIVIYTDSTKEDDLKGGLTMVNTTNVSFFDSEQKSELFRLKALFLNSLGGRAKSNQAFCQSLQICPTYAKSWLSWGDLCSTLAELTERQGAAAAATGTTESSSSSSIERKAIQYMAQAMGCYFEAMTSGASEWARVHIPRCLWMLRKEAKPGLLCQTFDSRSKEMAEWVWLPWIPQLLTALGRAEASSIRPILKRILMRYPQALYFGLRAFYLERRDIERAHRTPGSSSQQNFPAVGYAEDLMSSLRRVHSQLWASLEAILEELIIRFRPSLEEELLNTVNALLHRGTQALEKKDASDSYLSELLANFRKTLSRVGTKFFSAPTANTTDTSGMHDYRAKLASQFSVRYKNQFERDFMSGGLAGDVGVAMTLQTIVHRLGKWRDMLERAVAATPSRVPLHQVSPVLSSLSYEAPDLWAGK